MLGRISFHLTSVFAALVLSSAALAEEAWQVGKSSGEVWVVSKGAQPASLSDQLDIKPGDVIRTGRNGRALLKRGEETILVAPNSEIGIPEKPKDGLTTTILQKAGSILLNVEKRSEKHFDVETPYLAAVVKGTQFRVDVDANGARVNVVRGQVEVADFKSGQIAQVMPGQLAKVSIEGPKGIDLTGAGPRHPIVEGTPRAPMLERLSIPKGGLGAPQSNGRQLRASGNAGTISVRSAGIERSGHQATEHRARTRITAPLGEVRLDVGRATNHLVHSSAAPSQASRRNTSDGNFGRDGNGNGNVIAANAMSSTSAASSTAAAASASNGIGGGSANGNSNAGGNGNAYAYGQKDRDENEHSHGRHHHRGDGNSRH
jgi:hypothetical protein